MIIGISQLRQSIKLLRFFRGAFVDSGIKVDQVLARFASCREVDDDVALAVKAAGIAHVGIVIGRHVDVVVLGPADTLEMNADMRSGRPGPRRHLDDAGFDDEVRARHRLVTTLDA